MKLCKSSFEIWQQPSGLEGVYKQIEKVGRVCYKSEDKITEDSAKPFVDRMIKLCHGAVLEHGTVYLKFIGGGLDYDLGSRFDDFPQYHYSVQKYINNKYSEVREDIETGDMYITTNYRVLVENKWLDDLKYLCEPTEFHEKRVCVKFICDRGILAEFTRHRTFSFSAESTRYCNYSKDKFNNEITFIQPCWNCLKTGVYNGVDKFDGDYFEHSLREAELYYFKLLELGWKPQQARAVLPNALKTELVMTGFVSDWWGEYLVIDKSTGIIDQRIHGKFYAEPNNIDTEKYRIIEKGFFPLRCSKGAHPQAQELAVPLRETFINQMIW